MSYVMYKVSDTKWGWRGPEGAFRDFDGNTTRDETNAADGTFWALPVFIGSENPVLVRKRKKFSQWRAGSRFVKQLNFDEYSELILTFTGPVINRSWLYYLTDACATADDTPSTNYYTHQYDNADTHANPPKSFELIHRIPNDKSGGGESIVLLYTGCVVTNYVERADLGSQIAIGTWTVKAANCIAGTDLTTPGWPEYPQKGFFTFDMATLTWTKGGTALNGHFKGYTFSFNTDKALIREGGSYYAVGAKSPNNTDVMLSIDWAPTETDSYDDSQDDPLTALNKDITLKIARNTTTDYFQITIADGFQDLAGDPTWVEGNMWESHNFYMNPAEAASSLDLTEVNDINDDRYET